MDWQFVGVGNDRIIYVWGGSAEEDLQPFGECCNKKILPRDRDFSYTYVDM